MAAKSADLNKTWTLLPNEEEEEEEEEQQQEDLVDDDDANDDDDDEGRDIVDEMAMDFEETAVITLANENMSSQSMLMDERLPFDITLANRRSHLNTTRSLTAESSPCCGESNNSSRLTSRGTTRGSFGMSSFLKQFNYIDPYKCDSLFEETFHGLDFQ
jgi:hypothetical protein